MATIHGILMATMVHDCPYKLGERVKLVGRSYPDNENNPLWGGNCGKVQGTILSIVQNNRQRQVQIWIQWDNGKKNQYIPSDVEIIMKSLEEVISEIDKDPSTLKRFELNWTVGKLAAHMMYNLLPAPQEILNTTFYCRSVAEAIKYAHFKYDSQMNNYVVMYGVYEIFKKGAYREPVQWVKDTLEEPDD